MEEDKAELVICSYADKCLNKNCSHVKPHEFINDSCKLIRCDHIHKLVSCKPVVTDWDK